MGKEKLYPYATTLTSNAVFTSVILNSPRLLYISKNILAAGSRCSRKRINLVGGTPLVNVNSFLGL